ncbi:MAG: rhomboid family intramembrane serine protease [Anaerolineae bacterium]|jgi:membrane associated rhomboid family serine protease|nr:rhomboid family intramembrane serine protease [Anaerolineae bacterium]
MIPYRIEGRNSFRAYATFGLLVVTVLFFLWEVLIAAHHRQPIETYLGDYALVTCRVGQESLLETTLDGVRSIFLHTTFTGFVMNMVFLWLFGPAVERFMGHRRFLLFFFVAGFGGHIATLLFAPRGDCLTLIGPAGAIAGVLGAFLWLYPARRIETFIPLLTRKFDLPALFFALLYFALSIFVLEAGPLSGQIQPFWDEAGGLLTGLLIIFVTTLFKPAPAGNPLEHLDQ